MESKTTQIPEVAKDELEAPSSSSSDEQPQSEATTCPITKNVTDVRNTFYNLNILLKHQLDFLRTAVKEHRNMTNKQRSSNMKLLASIQQALNANMNSLRIKPNPFGLTVISARLAGIKESMSVVSNRLDAVEINTNDLTLALGRLNWREAHHIMLNNIYSNANLAMAYDSISIHEMVSVFAPEIKVPRKDSADEDWPEQFRDITIDTICPICHLELTEDPDSELEHGLAAGTISSSCCFQPFHTACLCTHLQQKKTATDCPLCRKLWRAKQLIAIIDTRISQWEEIEVAWKNRAILR